MLNALSIDVEEYYHAANLEPVLPPQTWHRLPSRVERSTDRLLEMFDQQGAKATFFILGSVARRHPSLVRRIADAGHEIASHGYGHRLVYQQRPKSFLRDVVKTKRLLEDLTSCEVLGYRAPNFSIRADVDWAYDVLLEAGYQYDSSLYPIWHPRYANLGRPRDSFVIKRGAKALTIVPLATTQLSFFGRSAALPVAGGAYWRLFPLGWMLKGLNRRIWQEHKPAICYLHPWEIDPGQPKVSGISLSSRIRHYSGLANFEERLQAILTTFQFTTIRNVIETV